MERKHLISGLLATAGASLLSTTLFAAPYVPNPGAVNISLIDGNNTYTSTIVGTDTDGDVSLRPRPRGPLAPGNVVTAGDQDFIVFKVDAVDINGVADSTAITGRTLTGGVTFAEVPDAPIVGATGFTTLPAQGLAPAITLPKQIIVKLADSTARPLSGAAAGTLGRFFLFDNTNANAGDFSTINPGSVDFATGTGVGSDANNVVATSSGPRALDVVPNFMDSTYPLLATGSLFPDFGESSIEQVYTLKVVLIGGKYIPYYQASVSSQIAVDGGLWFDTGVVQDNLMTFQANLFLYVDAPGRTVWPTVGDKPVYDGGWVGASTDPVNFTALPPVPEPLTGGLTLLSLSGIGGYLLRRRRA